MGLEGHHFLVIYNTVGIITDLESFGIVHVNVIHAPFTLMIFFLYF